MAHRNVARAVLLVAVSLLALACRRAAPPATGVVAPVTEVSTRSGDLVLRMEVSSAEVAVGEPLAVSFVLRNTGDTNRVL